MRVRDLIAALSDCDPDALVVVTGYEDGYDVPEVRHVTVYDTGPRGESGAWWSGRYQEADEYYTGDAVPVEAVEVGR